MKKLTFLTLCFLSAFSFQFLDAQVLHAMEEPERGELRNWGSQITELASGKYWFALAVLVYVLSHFIFRKGSSEYLKNKCVNLYAWSKHFILALLCTGILVQVIKNLVGRARPNSYDGTIRVFEFDPLQFKFEYQSFPSGHTQSIFCAAVFLSILWPKARWIFFASAFVISLARVVVLKHFPSDVFAGIVIGVFGAYFSIKYWSKWIEEPKPWKNA